MCQRPTTISIGGCQMADRGRHRFSGPKRLVEWAGVADQGYVSVADGGATLISSLTINEVATIVRTRGQVSVRPNVFAADLDIVGAIGVGIVSQEAFAAGVASIPEPFSDSDWAGWFVWRSFSMSLEFHTAASSFLRDMTFEVDSKAMRKIGHNEVVVTIAESQSGAFSISSPLRKLIKLS